MNKMDTSKKDGHGKKKAAGVHMMLTRRVGNEVFVDAPMLIMAMTDTANDACEEV